MGACTFYDSARGKTAREAFSTCRENAQYEHGHGGYSGTIAEKSSFKEFTPPKNMSIKEFIRAIEEYDESDTDAPYEVRAAYKVYDDKWGPAVCVKDGDTYLFFGYASE